MLVEHTVVVTGTDVQTKDTCRTLEKGRKWFSYCLNNHIRSLMEQWVGRLRPSVDSPYVFPGNTSGHISTATVRARFNTWCKVAGLSGPHLHPHALRHSYAHILLETGNTVDVVSKLLNHSNPTTTRQFYLTASAAQVAQRANIPWLKQQEKDPIIPNFLKPKASPKPVKKRKRKAMASLAMFADTVL